MQVELCSAVTADPKGSCGLGSARWAEPDKGHGHTFPLPFLDWVKVGLSELAEGWSGTGSTKQDIFECSCSPQLNISPSGKPTSH